MQSSTCCLVPADSLFTLLFIPEDGDSKFKSQKIGLFNHYTMACGLKAGIY
jgi:hypothetical protein